MDPVVVIGGGIIGTSVAYELASRDIPVVLYEKKSLGSGSTAKSMAIFFWHQDDPSPLEHRLRERAWDTYGPLIDDGTIEYTQIGTLDLARGAAEVEAVQSVGERLADFGVETDWLEAPALAEHGLDPAVYDGGLFVPADGYLDPAEIIQHFVGEATDRGAAIETGVEVTDVGVADGSVTSVDTTEGRQEASAVVNAAGPWAPEINAMVGVDLPLRQTRGPIIVLQQDEPFSLPFMVLDDQLYFREESRRQAFGGHFVTEYEDGEAIDPDANHSVAHQFYLDIADQIEAAVPRLADAEVVNDWLGLRCVTPDHRPFVGETAVGGFYTAVGMTGYGVTRGPAIGDMLADMIAGEPVDEELRGWIDVDRISHY